MIITCIRWRDACVHEAADSPEAIPELSELCEVGFLLAEDEHAVLIGMEQSVDGTHPGRWRLNIPKVNIVDRKDRELEKVFGEEKIRKPRKKKEPKDSEKGE